MIDVLLREERDNFSIDIICSRIVVIFITKDVNFYGLIIKECETNDQKMYHCE